MQVVPLGDKPIRGPGGMWNCRTGYPGMYPELRDAREEFLRAIEKAGGDLRFTFDQSTGVVWPCLPMLGPVRRIGEVEFIYTHYVRPRYYLYISSDRTIHLRRECPYRVCKRVNPKAVKQMMAAVMAILMGDI